MPGQAPLEEENIMIHFLSEYGIFLAKSVTVVIAILVVLGFIAALLSKAKPKERLKIKKLNEKYQDMQDTLNQEILKKKAYKQLIKQEKKHKKETKKLPAKEAKKRIFVLNFKGDIRATAVETMREAITAILQVATAKDEVVAKIESAGGTIHGYGLAASQLQRLRERHIPLTAIIDKVAASGGYLMASVAEQIYAAPFAIIGSIGVISQLPNFNRFLKKHNIDFEQITAGEYKRTLSVFGENTDKGRKKAQEEIEEAHQLFKNFVSEHRAAVNIDKLATGEYWYGAKAVALGLVDKLITSDDYLLNASNIADLYEITYVISKKKLAKLSSAIKSMTSLFL
jgi:serine protease SohB